MRTPCVWCSWASTSQSCGWAKAEGADSRRMSPATAFVMALGTVWAMTKFPGSPKPEARSRKPFLDLDHCGDPHASADAQRCHATPAAAGPETVNQRGEDAGAAGADRMTERDGPSPNVHLRAVQPQLA